jgi:hypothetical protein
MDRKKIVERITDWYQALDPRQRAALEQFVASMKTDAGSEAHPLQFPLPPYS